MTIRLTFCIPTYNRAALLRVALDSIISQANEFVDIVVSDNASTDETEATVQEFSKKFRRIKYFRQPQNLGFDRNMLNAVELATGNYCWLFGSDDALSMGAIESVFKLIDDGDVYLLDRVNMHYDFVEKIGEEKMLTSNPGEVYNCLQQDEILRYIGDARTIGGMFSYISALIVRKTAWEAVGARDRFIGSGYIHVSKLLAMVAKGAKIVYTGLPLVKNRTGNDELARNVGYTRRRLTDFSYGKIAAFEFPDRPAIVEKILERLAAQFFTLRVILSDKRSSVLSDGSSSSKLLAEQYSILFSGQPRYKVKIVLWHMMTPSLLSLSRLIFGRHR